MSLPVPVIEKLNASNYVSWSADMKFLLLERNCWDIVEGTEKIPAIGPETGKDVKDFKMRQKVALSLIYLFVEPDFRRIIENYTDPKESWSKLQEHFFPDNRSQHIMLFSELTACRIKNDEKIDMFAARLQNIFRRLVAIDPSFNELYMTFQLVRFLPDRFSSIVQNVLRCPKDAFKFDSVLKELISEETRISLRNEDVNSWTPEIYTSTVTRNHHRRKDVKDSVVCFNCGKRGHYKSECKQRKQRKESPSQDGEGSTRNKWKYKPSPNSDPGTSRRIPSNSKYSSQFLIQANVSETGVGDSEWVFDTAATHHFCNNRNLFSDFISLDKEEMAVAVRGVKFPIEGKGKVKLKIGQRNLVLNDVMYSPKLRKNLLSGPQFDKDKATFVGGKGEVKMSDEEGLIFKANLKNGIYYVKTKVPSKSKKRVSFETLTTCVDNSDTWHKRLAHISSEIIKQTSKSNSVKGLPNFRNIDLHCESCKLNKFRRVSFKSHKIIRSKKPLDLLYADVWGPCKTEGRKGERFFLSIIDDFSRRVALYPMREKSQVSEILKRHITRAERFLESKVKAIRTDNGREFINENFDSFCNRLGIKHELTNVYTPEQNGVAERFNQTVVNCTRTILHASGLNQSFWPEAMLYFTYTWNRMCHKNQKKTPFELYCGSKPSVRHTKPFGIIAYVGTPRQLRNKLDPKARKGVFLGYALSTKGYRIWLPENDKIIETINVSFNETTFYNDSRGEENRETLLDTNWFQSERNKDSESENEETAEQETPDTSDESEGTHSDVESSDEESSKPTAFPKRNTTWIRKVVPRPDGSRKDVYYYEKNRSQRLRSVNDAIKYCNRHNIVYEPSLFNFKGKWNYQGEITDQSSGASISFSEA